MAPVTAYDVRAKRWDKGWELHISCDGEHVGVTQVKRLRDADAQVRDYLETRFGQHSGRARIRLLPDLGGVENVAAAARERQERAAQETREAAEESRQAARRLKAAGLSGDEVAAVFGVSKSRISQLTH